MKLVIYPAIEPQRLVHVREAASQMEVVNATTIDHALREISTATAFFGKITPPLLAAAQDLQWVQSPTASLEHYLFPELIAHPCQLSNMRGLYSDVIADHVLGLVICFARNLHHYIRQQVQRRWEPIGGEAARSDFISGPGVESEIDRAHRHMADLTLGVVGVGAIGSEVVRRAGAFGMRTIGVDVCPRSVAGMAEPVWAIGQLPRLLAESDFVVIAAPHTPQTEKLFRQTQFQQMRKDAVLINIGRGAIVDLNDLVSALESRTIGGAGLDVFEVEPLPKDHPLWSFENVIMTPHIAGASTRVPERHLETLLGNIRAFVSKQPLLTQVDKTVWF